MSTLIKAPDARLFALKPAAGTMHRIYRLALDGAPFKPGYVAASLRNSVEMLKRDHVLTPALSYDKIRRDILDKGAYVAPHKLLELPGAPTIIISIVRY